MAPHFLNQVTKGMENESDEKVIEKNYTEQVKLVPDHFRSSEADIRESVKKRMPNECKDALALLKKNREEKK